ncbi:MAG TPA: cytochrome c biogenesis protein CcdA [Candidatus Dormibacteraeota bacterium]
MTALVYSSSLAAAFLGGVLALFAPCCIVSLLPAYLAAAVRRGPWRLIRLTGLFTVGVALVLLPVVLGIGALSQLLGTYHREVYFVVGLLLVLLGVLSLSGQGWMLPMPMFQTRAGLGRGDAASVLFLGMISGVASSCCAPVLVGVLALTALSSSVLNALGLGLAYVFGMVFPLLVAAILWERLKLDPGVISRLGAHRLKVADWSPKVTDIVGGIIFLAMGTIALYIAYTGQSTYTPDFMLTFNQWATGVVANVVQALAVVPPVVQGIALLLIAGLVGWLAWRRPAEQKSSPSESLADAEVSVEERAREESGEEEMLSHVAGREATR